MTEAETENLTILVLREIRDEIVTTRTELRSDLQHVRSELGAELHGVRGELHGFRTEVNERFGVVETTLRDLAEQQRFVVQHLSALTTRDRRIEAEVDELRGRVDAIEERLPR